jgi:hypothetical protein
VTPSDQPTVSDQPSLPSTTTTTPPVTGTQPESGALTTRSVTSTPGPVWSTTGPVTFAGPSQAVVMTSPQAGYVSGGCESPCGPSCKKHKLCPLKKHKASAVVLPSAQSTVSSCEAPAPCKVKKPCFLKTWLHHKSGCKSKGCKGCKSCSYCGEPAAIVSAQGQIASGQW